MQKEETQKEGELIKPVLIRPDVEIHPRELPEYEMGNLLFSKPIVIVPWGSLYQAHKLHLINWEYGKYYATFSRSTHLDKWDITKKMIDLGLKVVFNPNTSPVELPFKHVPWTDFAQIKCSPTLKDVDFSFVGWDSSSVRKQIFKLFPDKNSVIKRTGYFGHSDINRQKEHSMQYQSILSRSRFSLCPRGVGSSTMRLWESLEAGAIPILISDIHQMPLDWDWNNTIIRLDEAKVFYEPKAIERVLWRTTAYRENTLRANCLKAFEYFSNKINLQQYIESNF